MSIIVNSHDAKKPERDLVDICTDAKDPMGSGLRGTATQYNLGAGGLIGQPQVRYKDPSGFEFVLTCDVYQHEGAPLEVVLFCPRCSRPGVQHTLRISGERKAIEYDRVKGLLSIEPFGCTWEMDSSKPVGLISSSNLCGWKVGITKNVAKDA